LFQRGTVLAISTDSLFEQLVSAYSHYPQPPDKCQQQHSKKYCPQSPNNKHSPHIFCPATAQYSKAVNPASLQIKPSSSRQPYRFHLVTNTPSSLPTQSITYCALKGITPLARRRRIYGCSVSASGGQGDDLPAPAMRGVGRRQRKGHGAAGCVCSANYVMPCRIPSTIAR
jgi:hypothetical protein